MATAKPLEPTTGVQPLTQSAVGAGALDSWNGSAMTWLVPDPRALKSVNGKSLGRAGGAGLMLSRKALRTSTDSLFWSAALNPLPGAAMNWIFVSSVDGRISSFGPEGVLTLRILKAACTVPWMGAGRSVAP